MVLRIAITLLCGVGLYTTLFMLNKSRKAAAGLLPELSVVQTPRARLLGVPNAAIGAAYYPVLLVLVWLGSTIALNLAILAAVAAAAMSVVLAYSLVHITKMPCPFCWTGHVTNWVLLIVVLSLRFLG